MKTSSQTDEQTASPHIAKTRVDLWVGLLLNLLQSQRILNKLSRCNQFFYYNVIPAAKLLYSNRKFPQAAAEVLRLLNLLFVLANNHRILRK